MSAGAIVMMLIAMTVLWGGLAVAIYSLTRRGQGPDEIFDRDL